MKIIVIDNYDSFTYNLVQYIQDLLGHKVEVKRNDQISLEAIDAYDAIILSPGPGLPADAGIMPAILQQYGATKKILGVCLGHQAIGEAFGAKLTNLQHVYHGIQTPIRLLDPEDVFFADVPPVFPAGRYHSWIVKRETLPDSLVITALDDQGEIMAMRHRDYDIFGVQFHPESVMTPDGKQMLANFLTYCGGKISREALTVTV